MAKLLFHMFGEPGHMAPSLKLAKGLAARGHDVAYHALADFEASLSAEGLAVLPYLRDRFPKGSLAPEELPRLAARRKIVREYRAALDQLVPGGPVATQIAAFRPDLVVVDTMEVAYALLVQTMGIPIVQFTTSLPQTKERGVPPLKASTPWRAGLRGLAAAELAWQWHLIGRRAIDAGASAIGLPTRAGLVRECPRRFGMTRSVLDGNTAFLPQILGVPELVACPPSFDFPRASIPGRAYTESIDLGRHEDAPLPPMPSLMEDAPLVFCSMGTQAHRTPGVPAFLRRVVEALGKEPSLAGLVVHGGADLGAPPRNVTLVGRAPQLAVLRRAALMITHGGLGSVKECIAHGVPMIVYPLKDDQPGNGARVAFHGLGSVGSTRGATAESIARMIRQALAQPSRKRASLRAQFLAFEGEGRGVAAVEALLARG